MRTVVHYTDAVAFGGAEQMLLTLAEHLDPRRWRSVLLHHEGEGVEPLAAEAQRRGIEVLALPRGSGKDDLRLLPPMVRTLRTLDAAVLHAHLAWPLRCSLGLVAAPLAGIRYRVASQQLFAPLPRWRKRQRQRAVSLLVHRYLAVSDAMAAQLSAVIPGREKVLVVHNAVEVERFDRPRDAHLRAALAGGTGRPVVLTVARLDRQKGIEALIAAAAGVPEAVFVVAGDGPERAHLETDAAARGLGDRFHFLGSRTDVPDLLAACDLFVLPSRFEGLPVAVLEAMAARRPVVATAVDGNAEAVVDGLTGLLVPPADPGALAAAIRRVLADDSLARRLGAAGRARVEERFSARSMAVAVEQVYAELLGADVVRGQARTPPERRQAAAAPLVGARPSDGS